MKFRNIICALLLLLISISTFAASATPDPAPLIMLKNTSDLVLKELDKHIGKLKNNDKLVNSIVNRIVVPNFDLEKMSKSVVGPYWNKSSKVTQQQFVKEFTQYIIRTYSSAVQSYDGEVMKFYPIRGVVGNNVRISSDLVIKKGLPIQLQYGVYKKENKWLIYDFSVDGVSIVKNYRSQFAGTLRQKGLNGLVAELKKRNTDK